jgi:tetratricopeptide (TPR) repeat protein
VALINRFMTLANAARYQKIAQFWIYFFLTTAFVSLFGFVFDSDIGLLVTILGTVLSLSFCLTALILKKNYQLYEKVITAFRDLPALATWTIPAVDWEGYQLVEKENRMRSYMKYILWSPLVVILICLGIWAEVDDLSFDINLLGWGLLGYAVTMLLLYIQMKVGLNKTKHQGDHVIQLKTVGAQIDDSVTYWGKFVADEHSTFAQAFKAFLISKADDESKVNKAYILQEKAYQYLVVNYTMSENSKMDLYLPITDEVRPEIESKLSQLKSDYAFNNETILAGAKKYNSRKYLKWLIAGASVLSFGAWVLEEGLPIYEAWRGTSLFEEALAKEESGDTEGALRKYREAIVQNSEMREPYLNIGVLYLNAGNLDSALYYFDKTLEKDPAFDLALLNKGVVLHSKKEYKQAINSLRHYESVAPEKHNHDLMMGDSYYELEKYDTALIYYQRAYAENKKSASLCYMIGIILTDRLEDADAIPYLEESISLDSAFTDSYTSLALIYENRNEMEKSNYYYQLAEKFRPVATNP